MILTREELLSALFRETDRAQRMKMPLTLVKVDITLCEDGPAQPADPALDSALLEIVARFSPLLRCYDLVGKSADRDFLLVLPGCRTSDARSLVERLRDDGLTVSTLGCTGEMHFQACFGIASSGGRSPFVVLRDVDLALKSARAEGPGSIRSIGAEEETDEPSFLPVYQNEALHW